MSSAIAQFTARLLARHGALIDREAADILALVPARVASDLEIQEYQRFGFDRRADRRDGIVVDYDSPLLDRFERLVHPLGAVACATAPAAPLKPVDAEALVADSLSIVNGIVRDCRAEAGVARYVGFTVQYELRSDERVSGMVDVWVNTTMDSAPRFTDLMPRVLMEPDGSTAGTGRPVSADDLAAVAVAWKTAAVDARRALEGRLQDACESLRRRRARDLERLREHYESIDQEIRRRARRALAKKDERAVGAELSRLEATARAYVARAGDLVDRYRPRVRVEPLSAVVCTMAVRHVTARVHRRTASRTIALAWNPVDRVLEPPRCEGCRVAMPAVVLCDERVHLLCGGCHGACDACGRPFCRACHASCPRRHDAAGSRP